MNIELSLRELLATALPSLQLVSFTEAMAGPRQAVKQRGRLSASEILRSQCLERARTNRDALFEKLRGSQNELHCDEICVGHEVQADLRSLVRDVVLDSRDMEGWLDEEAAIALEEEIYLELCHEAELQAEQIRLAQEEAELLKEQQNEEDAALYEQHLLGGVCCPLCGVGRLAVKMGELCCSKCELHTQLMDEEMSLEQISELLHLAELRHDEASGCVERGSFEAAEICWGQQLLHFSCKKCGWKELVV